MNSQDQIFLHPKQQKRQPEEGSLTLPRPAWLIEEEQTRTAGEGVALPGRWERVGEPSESTAVSENPRREHVAWRRGGGQGWRRRAAPSCTHSSEAYVAWRESNRSPTPTPLTRKISHHPIG